MEQLFEVFEAELTARYPRTENNFADQKQDREERHFFLDLSGFELDIFFCKSGMLGVPHYLGCFLCEKDGLICIPYSRLLFALCGEKRYRHIEFGYIATERQLREAIALLLADIDRNVRLISDFWADRVRRGRLLSECAEELNRSYRTEVLVYDGEHYVVPAENDEENAEQAIEIYVRMSVAKKYTGAFVEFYKGNPEKALSKLCQTVNKGKELDAVAELAPEAVEIPALASRLYKDAHKGNVKMLLAEMCSWAVGSFFWALPTYLVLLGIYLLAAGVLDESIVFSTALAGKSCYLYPLLPALFSGVLATAFSSRFCYRVLYNRTVYRAYYAMLRRGMQKTAMRIFACVMAALLAVMAYTAGSAGTKFEEHRIAHADIGDITPQYYSYEHVEKVQLAGERATVELHFEDGEILPLYGLSEKNFKLYLAEFLTEKGIKIENKE